MPGRLQDRVAIITGAGTGIGQAVSLAYAKEGVHVVGAARRVEKLEETGEKVRAFETKFLPLKCDVSIKSDCENVAKETIMQFGKIDILVNNAGIFPVGRFLDGSAELWDTVMATNLRGYVHMCQAVIPQMIQQKAGKIIMVNSIQARMGMYHQDHYACSKAAILGLTRMLATEFGKNGILVNGIACGYTPETEGCVNSTKESIRSSRGADVSPEHEKRIFAKFEESMEALIPLGRCARTEDYQGIMVFLASDDSNYITGQTIAVDGGVTMA